MPELPEVEVVRLFLEDKLLHQTITGLEILNPKSFVGDPCDVIDQKILKLTRIGKQLSLHLSNGLILLVHLKMTGQLILQTPHDKTVMGHPTKDMLTAALPNKSTRLIFTFQETSLRGRRPRQSFLYFNDQRKFGWVRLFKMKELKDFQQRLGLDIFDPDFTPQYLYSQLQRTSRPVKQVLLDQDRFAGIGNIYANDALFLAKIHPQTSAKNITLSQAKLIHRNLIAIMQQSVLAGGSTTKDQKYLRPDGTPGGNQFFFRVYQRAGEPCLVCGTKIERLTLGGRGTFFCPHCQKIKV